MGYYADLIKQKQEKRNFRADPLGFGPTVVGVGTPDDYKAKFKVGDKVKFYSGEGVIVKGPIKMRFSLTPTYHIKVTKGKEAGREVSRYEEELKKNSKEEKDNGKVFETWDEAIKWLESQGYEVDSVNRTRPSKWVICYKGGYEYEVEFAKLTYRGGEVNYEVMGRISEVGPKRNSKDNEKEEKDNEAPEIATARRKALQKLEDAQKKANWYGDTTMQKLKHDLTYADEETLLDLVEVLDRYLPKFEAKVKSFGNSNEEKGYYAKLAEEKASRKH